MPQGFSKAVAAGGLSMSPVAFPSPSPLSSAAAKKSPNGEGGGRGEGREGGEEEAEDGFDENSYFSFEAGAAYESGCTALEAAQAAHDPQLVANLLRSRPFHAGTLLVVFDLCRLTGQHERADDALAAAVGALEAAWHPGFAAAAVAARARLVASSSSPSCSSSSSSPSCSPAALNRLFLLSLFRRAASLSRRSLHGAALETAKLGLSLDPRGDPLGFALCLDYFALRAGANEFVVRAASAPELLGSGARGGRSPPPPSSSSPSPAAAAAPISSLPNWAFSVPLARLRLAAAAEKEQEEEEKRRKKDKRKEKEKEREKGKSKLKKKELGGGDDERAPSSSSAPFDFERERAQAKAGLVRAASLYPLAVVRLCARLAEAGAPPGTRLSAALARPPFSAAAAEEEEGEGEGENPSRSASLSRLCDLFAERHHPIWKQGDAAAALVEAAEAAAEQHEGPAGRGAATAAAFRAAREALWPPTPPSPSEGDPYSHLTPLDFADSVAPLPDDEVNAMNAAGQLGGGGGGGNGVGGGNGGGGGRGRVARAIAAHLDNPGAALAAPEDDYSDDDTDADDEELERREVARALAAVAAFEEAGHRNSAAAAAVAAAAEAQLRQLRERGPLAALFQTLAPWHEAGGAVDHDANNGDQNEEGEEGAEEGQQR